MYIISHETELFIISLYIDLRWERAFLHHRNSGTLEELFDVVCATDNYRRSG